MYISRIMLHPISCVHWTSFPGRARSSCVYVNIYMNDLFQPNISPTLSFYGMYQNHLFIVGIEPILNKELEFVFLSDRSDHTCVYNYVSVLYDKFQI